MIKNTDIYEFELVQASRTLSEQAEAILFFTYTTDVHMFQSKYKLI